jgi:hypothetical protein
MCVLIFSTAFVHYLLFLSYFNELEFYRQDFRKISIFQIQLNSSRGSLLNPREQTGEQTDGHDAENIRFSPFANA